MVGDSLKICYQDGLVYQKERQKIVVGRTVDYNLSNLEREK